MRTRHSIAAVLWHHALFVLGLVTCFGLVAMPETLTWANDNAETRASLRGLQGIGLLIGEVEPEIERGGFTKKQLQAETERRLRQAGIAVLSSQEAQQIPGAPFLVVSVSTLRHSAGLYAYSIDVRVYQAATLVRDATPVSVPTWSIASIGMVGATQLQALFKSSGAKVEQFIRAYRAVNPRAGADKASLSQPATAPQRQRIRQVQERLQAAGFSPGPVDGALGSRTRDALRRYQRAKGLRSTGEPDKATLKALGVQ